MASKSLGHHPLPSTSDSIRESHSVSLKVLRLSQPSFVFQYAIPPPVAGSEAAIAPMAASLAFPPFAVDTNADPFVLSPILRLPASFGSTHVGETFACTLCVNSELSASFLAAKRICDVRIAAEMKTPISGATHSLDVATSAGTGADLDPEQTLQRLVSFQLTEKGVHVLAITVTYYEATDTSGRSRSFRKLYRFICKPALVVRTKVTPLPVSLVTTQSHPPRRWVLEAQLENCGDDSVRLETVAMDIELGLLCEDLNWKSSDSQAAESDRDGGLAVANPLFHCPVLQPGEVEQVCFVITEEAAMQESAHRPLEQAAVASDRIILGGISVGWRGEMGTTGLLSTGKLGTRAAAG